MVEGSPAGKAGWSTKPPEGTGAGTLSARAAPAVERTDAMTATVRNPHTRARTITYLRLLHPDFREKDPDPPGDAQPIERDVSEK
ncbi:hypothetical protein SRABI128_02258 [Microbacterium sp. Bi128]|nr:hypothetical protein SRABI128_02258 [Microbacterium sp. Bi128]